MLWRRCAEAHRWLEGWWQQGLSGENFWFHDQTALKVRALHNAAATAGCASKLAQGLAGACDLVTDASITCSAGFQQKFCLHVLQATAPPASCHVPLCKSPLP
jgi:hypothetical protein